MSHEHSIIIPEADWVRLNFIASDDRLKSELENAAVVHADDVPLGVVTMDSRVRFEDLASGEVRDVTIVYPEKADASRGQVSVLAPVGSALIGLSVGQTILWPFPDGSNRTLRVLELLFQPEAGPAPASSKRKS